MTATAKRNFHLPLAADDYEQLREAAQREGRPATALVREALREWLAERRRRRVAEEIAESIQGIEGTALDLDPDLEAAGAECLLASTEWED